MIPIIPNIRIKQKRNRILATAIHYVLSILWGPWAWWRRRHSPRFASCQRILLIRPDHIGDVVMTLGFFREMRQAFPDKQLDLLCSSTMKSLEPMFAPYFSRIRYLDIPAFQKGKGSWRETWRFFRGLQGEYDALIDCRGDFRIAILMFLSGVPKRIGFEFGGCGFLLSDSVPYNPQDHWVDITYGILDYLGVSDYSREPSVPLGTTEGSSESWRSLLKNRPLVAICPGARWYGRLWPSDRFAQVADYVARTYGATIALTGAPSDKPLCREIESHMSSPAHNLAGKLSLREFMHLLQHCDLIITVESGQVHLAAVTQTPMVALYGPADPRQSGPYWPDAKEKVTVLYEGHRFPCSPCGQKRCIRPNDSCMQAITTEAVIRAVDRFFQKHPLHGPRTTEDLPSDKEPTRENDR